MYIYIWLTWHRLYWNADNIYNRHAHAQKYVLERRKKKKELLAEMFHTNFDHSLPKIFVRNLSSRITHTHTLMHGYALIPAQTIRKWIYLFDYMVATALDQWNERDTLISLLIILWRSLWRTSSWHFPKVEVSCPFYLRRPRSWRINIEHLSSPTG